MNYLISIVLVMILLLAWCSVQAWSRRYARRHPEFGPAREEGGGCGVSCRCNEDGEKCKNALDM
ncbi:MAG: chemotaxis protein [Gammaproteobacteria bacterium]|jgi:hypothetical protein|nr:chemotaxis protein [Gammaproteobacteria bacterium]